MLIGGLGAIILVGLVSVGCLLLGGSEGEGDNSPDHPGGLHYLCGGCNKAFVLTTKQLAEHHKANWGQPVAGHRKSSIHDVLSLTRPIAPAIMNL